MLDCYVDKHSQTVTNSFDIHASDIGFGAAQFTWSADSALNMASTEQRFKLRVMEDVVFKSGGFNLIVGPTGSGKTSMLMALLGELHYVPLNSHSWLNLPRDAGVAYAAQEAWIQNATIKVRNDSRTKHNYSSCDFLGKHCIRIRVRRGALPRR